jgi:hypothetical protein
MYRVVFHKERWDIKTGDEHWSEFSQQPMMLK